MIVFICVSKNNGIMFNGRRQSQDRALRSLLTSEAGDTLFWMSPYSQKQFSFEMPHNPVVDEEFLFKAGENDICFVEGEALRPVLPKIKELCLIRWGRDYPADAFLDLDLTEDGFVLSGSRKVQGSSHPEIMIETYVRKEN